MQKWKSERMRKTPEKWPMTIAVRIDVTPVLFKFFFVSEKPSETLFFILGKKYWSKIKG